MFLGLWPPRPAVYPLLPGKREEYQDLPFSARCHQHPRRFLRLLESVRHDEMLATTQIYSSRH
eukprot:8084178-Prorocentrum_lima.AAC.1